MTKAVEASLGQTLAAGEKSPYLVLTGYRPEQDAKDMSAIGFDAVTATPDELAVHVQIVVDRSAIQRWFAERTTTI